MDIYISPFLTSFFVAAIIGAALILFAKKNNLNSERKVDRHIHAKNISRFGGVALILAFVLTIFLDKRIIIDIPLASVLVASIVILIFGVIDDVKQLSWQKQLFFQIIIISFIYFLGVRLHFISNPFGGIFLLDNPFGYFIGFLVAVSWIVLLINSMNWLDGADGISAGISFITGVTILILSLRPEVNQPPIGIMAAAFLGGLLAFFILNFNPAKIMAGTSGSVFMGFILAVLAIFSGAKIATTLLVLTIPVLDALWVIGERIRAGQSIFLADKRHLHHKLLKLGWSQKKICIFYCGITALIAIISLNTRDESKLAAFLLLCFFMLIILYTVSQKART
ncbi:MAG TPA: MraY family glycosyltransferase [Candidatus Moranbacteria bacterium]|nr:MraY family glycosyltransferase [Candidatus Moranbacteria bacterium]